MTRVPRFFDSFSAAFSRSLASLSFCNSFSFSIRSCRSFSSFSRSSRSFSAFSFSLSSFPLASGCEVSDVDAEPLVAVDPAGGVTLLMTPRYQNIRLLIRTCSYSGRRGLASLI